jgi:quercetin dioxygenase-like cupin family protein
MEEKRNRMQTTFLKRKAEMPSKRLDRCHDGDGEIDWIGVLDGESPGGDRLRFVHDDILPPGTSIGNHRHTSDQEYYYIVSGRGVMTLDGREYEVAAGDVTAVLPGGSHGLENRSDGDIRVIVISVAGGEI